MEDVRNVSQIITVNHLRFCNEDISDETTEIFRTMHIGRQFIRSTGSSTHSQVRPLEIISSEGIFQLLSVTRQAPMASLASNECNYR